MVVFSFWIFDRHTRCIFQREYDHQAQAQAQAQAQTQPPPPQPQLQSQSQLQPQVQPTGELYPGSVNTLNESNESKLLYGMVHSLRSISNQLSTNEMVDEADDGVSLGTSLQLGSHNKVNSIKTLLYTIHLFETISGTKFVLLTSNDVDSSAAGRCLVGIHSTIWIPNVIKNPMSSIELTNINEYIYNKPLVMRIDSALLAL